MDTLDKVAKNTGRYGDLAADAIDELETRADEAVEEVSDAARRIDWWQVAGYAVVAVTAVGAAAAAYVAYRQQAKTPASRIGRLRDQLGMSDVDFRDLRSTYNRVDFDKLNRTRRHLGTAAKKATHKGAVKVANWTR